jgi:hypothetical protein
VNKRFFAATLIAALGPFGVAQENRTLPPVTMSENAQIAGTHPGAELAMRKGVFYPPFCPPKACLYYAGDFESSYSAGDLLANSDYGSIVGQAWVGVKPDRDATVTGATFVEGFPGSGPIGVNPTPFAVQVGIKPGQAGKTVCSTNGNAIYKLYGNGGEAVTYSYTIKKLAKSCKLKKGRVYYVNLLPILSNGFGYVWNVPPMPQNHKGWKNDPNHCYFNGAAFGLDYVTCDSQGPFSVLDIGLTGKE